MERMAVALLVIIIASSAFAEPCSTEISDTKVTGVSQCLLIKQYGPADPTVLLIWLHGDVSDGGPANFHFPLAQKAAEDFAADKVLSVAIVRPGYPDGSGESSTVSFSQSGRSDHYTKENIEEVGAAIEKLRFKYKPKSLIIVGHSGGAATAAVLLGMKPQLADAAVLVACPCELVSWRSGRRAWSRSQNPSGWIDKVSTSTKVVALTGTKDDNTSPDLAKIYVDLLKSRGVDAIFRPIVNSTHRSAFISPEVFDAISNLLPH
jgi:pimeloyl-ACP methyl ester carboxylesterase